jgi:predicted SnoaL-like aldol condensation-catalyzing enzyme
MPTPEENMQSVRDFAEEVFGRKNLDYAADWLADDFVEHQVFPGTTPDKKGAIDSYRIFFAASPDMTAEIHDMVAAGDKVAIRATYRGTDQGGFIPNTPATQSLPCNAPPRLLKWDWPACGRPRQSRLGCCRHRRQRGDGPPDTGTR